MTQDPESSPVPAASDRGLEIYKAVRAHEITLNEARASLEDRVLTPLIALNGGAVVAFLTLLGALSGKESGVKPNYWVAACAIVVWGTGLLFAALAVSAASNEQAQVNTGYRLMREIVEHRVDEDV